MSRNEKILRRVKAGASYGEVAAELKVTRNIVAGVVQRSTPAPPLQPGKRVTLKVISEALDVCPRTLERRLKEWPDFPSPLVTAKRGVRLWRSEEVIAWALEKGIEVVSNEAARRTSGRPKIATRPTGDDDGRWTIRGVDPQLRERAVEAATAQGGTVGDWISEALRAALDGSPADRAVSRIRRVLEELG